ncbi:transglycosylase SLT domain-containing protein [Aestuariispira insulae]|uniref:Transglycosylase-like protein with SLT domain n=1 Tax=Aestuariispira insulae TaxID=1461337 RepID=A0A3D9HS86_9PROT|nr:transglycosylase SLT domain-containing protein [Aestuariispira insulae]RED52354.1 transglycosylase-like protein with SLT domain [Aestuariispira insulae]
MPQYPNATAKAALMTGLILFGSGIILPTQGVANQDSNAFPMVSSEIANPFAPKIIPEEMAQPTNNQAEEAANTAETAPSPSTAEPAKSSSLKKTATAAETNPGSAYKTASNTAAKTAPAVGMSQDTAPGQIAVPANLPLIGAEETSDATICQKAIRGAEKMMGIPPHMLHAVALTESGKMVRQEGESGTERKLSAWPWTVMAEGRGRYLPNKAAAIAEVKALQAKGIRNIDVGCMQVNLGYHGKAFNSLEEAFTPNHNVAYAAAFLARLKQERHSWNRAVGYYHSSDKKRGHAYRMKVIRLWKQLERAYAQSQVAQRHGKSPLIRSYQSQKKQEILARTRALQKY